jgi:hypothetical protein
MLTAIGLGIWLSKNPDLFAKKNIFMWILFPISLGFIIAYQFFSSYYNFLLGDYHFLIFPYSAFLVLVAIKLIPRKVNNNNYFVRGIRVISKSTYHILLTQILYFAVVISLWGDHYGASILGFNLGYEPLTVFLYLLVNWIICIPIGCLWWYGENMVREYLKLRKK